MIDALSMEDVVNILNQNFPDLFNADNGVNWLLCIEQFSFTSGNILLTPFTNLVMVSSYLVHLLIRPSSFYCFVQTIML